ncbi:hypothetical protein EDC04DRAFT_2884599 [Pisolithus marmoratus]|nr:hypothetical protein EDC04DRAFT_2884599 [Pisolithus marmoratus]
MCPTSDFSSQKPLSNLQTSAPFRGSDRRKLKQRVIVAYNVSPEIGDILVPERLILQKFATNTNAQGVPYWSPDGDPLWFSHGKGADDLIPTVYTLSKKYDLLPCITTPASVIPVLVGGADLMIPGVVQIPSSQTVVPPQLVAIAQYITDSPTMRGTTIGSRTSGSGSHKLKAGGKGKAVHLLYNWKDYLFTMGSKADPPGVVEIQEVGESKESEGEIAGTSAADEQRRPSVEVQEVEGGSSRTEVSSILRNAVLQAIRGTLNSIPTSSFPIPAGTFYSSCALPYRPAFHSTYKSLAAFLKVLDKQGILTIKDMKLEPLVMSVSASHSEVLSYTPYKREGEERARVQEMEIKELWKPHTPSGSASSSALYIYPDLKATVIKYVTARQLVNAHDQAYVNVGQDEVLLSAVAGKNESGDSLEFLKQKMWNWYEIRTEGQEPLLRKGQLKPISVVVKTRQGRRVNTLISGFEPFLLEAEVVAEELRRICAGSTGVSPLPGKPTRSEVLVQGKQTKAVVDFLLSKGVPKKWIETADLTVKK